jgi:hypothetical protein
LAPIFGTEGFFTLYTGVIVMTSAPIVRSIFFIPLSVLAVIIFGMILVAVPSSAAPGKGGTPFAEGLEGLADKDAKTKDLFKRRLLQPGPGQAERLQAVRDELNEMLSKYEDLKSTEKDKAVSAIRYFSKYEAAEYIAVALKNSKEDIIIAAVESLSELKAKSVLPQVLDALERNNFVAEGSETATIHTILVSSLLKLVNKLSDKEYKASPTDTEAIANIIKNARKK